MEQPRVSLASVPRWLSGGCKRGTGGTESSIRVSLRSVFFSFLLLVNSVVFHDAESRCRHAVLKLLAKRGPGNKPRTTRGLRSARGGGVVQHSQYRCRCWCWCWLVASAGRAGRAVGATVRRYPNSTTLHATRPACTLQPHRPTPRTPQPHLSHTRATANAPRRKGRARPSKVPKAIQLGASWTSPAAHKRTLVRRTSRTWYGTSSRSSLFALTKSGHRRGLYFILYIIHIELSPHSPSRESETRDSCV